MKSSALAYSQFSNREKLRDVRVESEAAAQGPSLIAQPWQSLLPRTQTYPAQTELFSQGSQAHEVYLLVDGAAKLVRVDPQGRELIVGLRRSSCFLGLAAVILAGSHPVSAVTITPSDLVRVPAQTFLDLLKTNLELSRFVHETLSREVCEQTERLAELGSLSSSQRVKQMLHQIIRTCQTDPANNQQEIRLMLPMKQCEIASMLAITPEHLSRVLRQLCNQGVIRWHKGWLVVPNIERLQA